MKFFYVLLAALIGVSVALMQSRVALALSPQTAVRPPIQKTATPPIADDYYLLGKSKLNKQDYQGAIADFDKALSLNLNDAKAYLGRGSARYAQGDKQGAIADFNKALSLNPNDADVYLGRGIIRYEQGDKQGALADFNKALSLNPNGADIYLGRGVVRYEQGDKQGALADFQQAETLAQEQGNTRLYQAVQKVIKVWFNPR